MRRGDEFPKNSWQTRENGVRRNECASTSDSTLPRPIQHEADRTDWHALSQRNRFKLRQIVE
jgi:hypothetical protein